MMIETLVGWYCLCEKNLGKARRQKGIEQLQCFARPLQKFAKPLRIRQHTVYSGLAEVPASDTILTQKLGVLAFLNGVRSCVVDL